MTSRMCVFSRARVVAGVLAVGAALGAPRPVLADDDDPKLTQRRPAVIGKLYHGPDAWKAALRRTPIGNSGDDVFPMHNIVLKTWIPLNLFPGFPGGNSSGADCWGFTSPTNREYALMGLSWGNGFVDVTDPASPIIRPTIPGGVNSLWRDITVIGHYAYAVSDQNGVGIQVMDLANLDTGSATLIRDYSQGGHTTTHTILSNPTSGFLYLCGGNATGGGGMVPASTLSNPTFPTFSGPGWTTQYVHEAQIETYTEGPYQGREIAFLFAGGPYYGPSYTRCLSIVDVTNKAAPEQLSFIAYPGMRFCHQGWISPDKKYLYIDDELDGPGGGDVPPSLTRVFDISDLSAPRLVSTFEGNATAIDHNQYAVGRYLFQSNYTSGLHVFDLSDPLKPFEIASIDTHPEDDSGQYRGAWGNYPFFGSGTVLISDLERGLFIVRVSILEMSTLAAPPAAAQPNTATPVSVRVVEKDATIGGVSVMVSVNGGPYTAYAMAGAGGDYSGTLPARSCGDRIRYYFLAQTNEPVARDFTWPLNAAAGDTFRAVVQTARTTIFTDDFEAGQGWTVQGTAGSGTWTRAVPLHDGGPGAVIDDADGSGRCYLTGNALNGEVNGGPTRLLSPVLDLSGAPEAHVTVSRWLLSIQGATDNLITEVSGDNGSNWTQVDSIGPASGGWHETTFRIADYVAPSSQVRVRFSVADAGSDSVTEAGIDAFSVWAPDCGATPCYANCDGSTGAPVLNVNDFICFQSRFAANDPYADCDGNTALNVNDFICFQSSFAAGCP